MSLAGICWNIMAFSISPKRSVFRKIIITEKNLPSVSNATKSIGFSICFCIFATKKRRHLQRILGRNHDWYLTAYKNIEICLKIFRNPQKRPLNGLWRVLSFTLTRRSIKGFNALNISKLQNDAKQIFFS